MKKLSDSQVKAVISALPPELEELTVQLAGSGTSADVATALVQRATGFPKLRSLDGDFLTPKHAPLLKKVAALEALPKSVCPTAKAMLQALSGRTMLRCVDLSGLGVSSKDTPRTCHP